MSPGYHGSNENIVSVLSFWSSVVALSVLLLFSVATLWESFGEKKKWEVQAGGALS